MTVNLGDGLVAVEGRMVSANAERFALALREYDPGLELQWIPPETHARPGQPEFRVVFNSPTGPYTLFFLYNEGELNAQSLLRVMANDNRNGAPTLSEYELWEQAQDRIAHQEYLDRMEEMIDVTKHVLQSRKHTYVVDPNLVFKSGVPHNAAHDNGN